MSTEVVRVLYSLARRRVLLTLASLLSSMCVWSLLRRLRLPSVAKAAPHRKGLPYPNAPDPLRLRDLSETDVSDPAKIAVACNPLGDDHAHVVLPPCLAAGRPKGGSPRTRGRGTPARPAAHPQMSLDCSSPPLKSRSSSSSSSSSCSSASPPGSPVLPASPPPAARRGWDVAVVFERVVEFMRDGAFAPLTSAMADSEKLGFYGSYKQATVGKCTTAMPPLSDVVGCMKWRAWSGMGDMTSENAKVHYVQQLARLRKVWEADPALASNDVKRRAVLHLTFLENLAPAQA